MEEIVRAFNYVIDQGWVRAFNRSPAPLRVPHVREVRRDGSGERGCSASISVGCISQQCSFVCRPSTGPRLSGPRATSKKPTVRIALTTPDLLQDAALTITPSSSGVLDVASKLGLIAPIAEQCQHKWVSR